MPPPPPSSSSRSSTFTVRPAASNNKPPSTLRRRTPVLPSVSHLPPLPPPAASPPPTDLDSGGTPSSLFSLDLSYQRHPPSETDDEGGESGIRAVEPPSPAESEFPLEVVDLSVARLEREEDGAREMRREGTEETIRAVKTRRMEETKKTSTEHEPPVALPRSISYRRPPSSSPSEPSHPAPPSLPPILPLRIPSRPPIAAPAPPTTKSEEDAAPRKGAITLLGESVLALAMELERKITGASTSSSSSSGRFTSSSYSSSSSTLPPSFSTLPLLPLPPPASLQQIHPLHVLPPPPSSIPLSRYGAHENDQVDGLPRRPLILSERPPPPPVRQSTRPTLRPTSKASGAPPSEGGSAGEEAEGEGSEAWFSLRSAAAPAVASRRAEDEGAPPGAEKALPAPPPLPRPAPPVGVGTEVVLYTPRYRGRPEVWREKKPHRSDGGGGWEREGGWWIWASVLSVFAYSLAGVICALSTFNGAWSAAEVALLFFGSSFAWLLTATLFTLLASFLGLAALFLRSRPLQLLYALALLPSLVLVLIFAYVTYTRAHVDLPSTLSGVWVSLSSDARAEVQSKMECCGWPNPWHLAVYEGACKPSAPIQGCAGVVGEWEGALLRRMYRSAVAVVALQVVNIVVAFFALHLGERPLRLSPLSLSRYLFPHPSLSPRLLLSRLSSPFLPPPPLLATKLLPPRPLFLPSLPRLSRRTSFASAVSLASSSPSSVYSTASWASSLSTFSSATTRTRLSVKSVKDEMPTTPGLSGLGVVVFEGEEVVVVETPVVGYGDVDAEGEEEGGIREVR
ncbi:hypothetical protein JCM8097_009088 [Rhodosporidiobolus ruineniae]